MVQVGTTKDQGLYNKPSAAVHPRALAAGTLPQYNTIQLLFFSSNSHDVRRAFEMSWGIPEFRENRYVEGDD